MSPGVGWARQPCRDSGVPSDWGPTHSPAVFSAAWQRCRFVLHLAGCGDRGARTPPGGELIRPRRRPAGSGEGLGLLSGLHSPGRSRAAAAGGARSFRDAGDQAESRARGAGARAACGFTAGPLGLPAQRGGGAATPRGAAEGRRERSAGERRDGRASRGRCSANLRALTRGAAPRRSDISWPGAGRLELRRAGAALRVGPLHLPDRSFAPRAPSRSPSRPSLSSSAF